MRYLKWPVRACCHITLCGWDATEIIANDYIRLLLLDHTTQLCPSEPTQFARTLNLEERRGIFLPVLLHFFGRIVR